MNYKIKKVKDGNGVRNCMIVNADTGIPLVYPNLYMSVIFRIKNYSFSTMESIANSLLMFERYNTKKNVSLFNTIQLNWEVLVSENGYLYDLINFLSYKSSQENVIDIKKKRHITEKSLYFKIVTIESYIKWFVDKITFNESNYYDSISRAFDFIKPRIENAKNYNIENEDKALSRDQVITLLNIVDIESATNPYAPHVRFRNNLIIKILLETGMRGGELLNLKLTDFNYKKKNLCIVRRPDDKDEPRLRQPLVKTLERQIPLSSELTEFVHEYINNSRNKQSKSVEHDYLLVTHSSNCNLGSPLTISGYQKIFEQIRKNSDELSNLVGHALRHTWNVKFSEMMLLNCNPDNYAFYDKVRNYLMGWKNDSYTSDIYNRRFIIQESQKIMAVINPLKNIVEDKSNVSNTKKATRKSIFGF
ncbi:tyrosine-type recombinase/integrase [Salmonella enterica]